MPHCWLARYQRFYYYVFYLLFQFFNFFWAFFFTFLPNNLSINLLQTFLVSLTSPLLTLILNIVFTLLIDSVIRKMHVNVFHVARFGALIWLSCETCQSFLEKIDFHGVDSKKKHVNPEVKLQTSQ